MSGALKLSLAAAMVAIGCGPRPYVPPRPGEPRALVKLRRVYRKTPGPKLRELVLVNGHRLYRDNGPRPETPKTDALYVHPEPIQWSVSAKFYHIEQQSVQESYQVQVPYTTTESYSCGSPGEYRTCTRSVTRYRSETRYRTVIRNVEVSDGSCGRKSVYRMEDGGVYLLQYSFSDDGACRLTCVEQGQEQKPCQVAALPPED